MNKLSGSDGLVGTVCGENLLRDGWKGISVDNFTLEKVGKEVDIHCFLISLNKERDFPLLNVISYHSFEYRFSDG
jgi:hypothetical protein